MDATTQKLHFIEFSTLASYIREDQLPPTEQWVRGLQDL